MNSFHLSGFLGLKTFTVKFWEEKLLNNNNKAFQQLPVMWDKTQQSWAQWLTPASPLVSPSHLQSGNTKVPFAFTLLPFFATRCCWPSPLPSSRSEVTLCDSGRPHSAEPLTGLSLSGPPCSWNPHWHTLGVPQVFAERKFIQLCHSNPPQVACFLQNSQFPSIFENS